MSTRRKRTKLSAADIAAIVLAIPEHDGGPVGEWGVSADGAVSVWWCSEDRRLSVRVGRRETIVTLELAGGAACGETLTQSIKVGDRDTDNKVCDLVRLIETGWDWLTGRKIPPDLPAHVPDEALGVGGHRVAAVRRAYVAPDDTLAKILLYDWMRNPKRDPDAGCIGKGDVA
jgi:hypothetical protein